MRKIKNKSIKNKDLEELDIITFLADNLKEQYTNSGVLTKPKEELLISFFEEIFVLISDYILAQISQEEAIMVYFINKKLNLLGNGVTSKLNEIVSILKQSIQSDVVYKNDKFLEEKEYYTKILKDNHKMAHIYLLDKFNINAFYVPPFLVQRQENIHGIPFRLVKSDSEYRIGFQENIHDPINLMIGSIFLKEAT